MNIFSKDAFKTGLGWLFFIGGIALYAMGYSAIFDKEICNEICIKVADVLVIGVVVGFLTNAAQFLGVFKKELQDIIYGEQFLKQRKDLSKLWETLSKEMLKNKFRPIHKDFLKVINSYLQIEDISFYEEYEVSTTIEWVNSTQGIIKVTDSTSFNLIAESKNKFYYPLRTWVSVSRPEDQTNCISEILVNGKAPIITHPNETRDNGNICTEQQITLSGATKYEIKYTREKIYNINEDFYIGFRAKYIVNKLRVRLEHPSDISVLFICRGTQEDFIDVKNQNNLIIEKKYKGIILPRQGYIFSLQKQ